MSFIKWAIVLAIGIFIGMSFASAALADDIISYYKLDESSGDVVDELGTYDGTNYGATRGVAGIINDAFDFDDDYVRDFGESLLENDFTVNVWVTTEEASSQNYAVGQSVSASGHYRFMIGTSGDQLYMRQHRGGGTSSATGSTQMTYDGSVWYMMTFVSNSTGAYGYLNGGLEASIIEGTALYSGINQGLTFGVKYYNSGNRGGPWEGKLDEIGIWDRQLSEAEIIALYNSGAGESFPFDGYVNLHSPADDYVSPTTSVDFNATAFANVAQTFVNMTLYHNASGTWTAIETQSITGIENTTNWTDTFSDGDDFIWGVQACDTATCFFSVNRSLIVDMTNPIIDIITPVNGTLFDLFKEVGNTQDINYTITDTNLDTCWYEYNGVNITFGTYGNCDGRLYSPDIGEEDLIAYYELDETTGVVVDELGTNNGTNNGATRGVAGIIIDAFDFDGNNDYVDVTGISSDNTWSVSVWVNADNLDATSKIFDCSTGRTAFEYQTAQGGWLYYDTTYRAVGITEKFLDTWQHWVITQNGTDLEIYQNGSSIYSTTSAGKSLGGTCVLGGRYTGADYFDGTLDEIGIWDSQLSEAEIIELYNSGMGQRPIDTFTLENVGTLPLHELTFYANDTAGNVGSNSTSWEYRGFITNQTFESPVLETSTSNYTLDLILGTNTSFSVGSLFVNGTEQSTGSFTTVGNNVSLTSLITVPSITTGSVSELFDVYWNLTLADTISGTTYNNLSSTQQQNVTELMFNFCGNGGATTPVLNFTMMDEITNVEINATANATTFEATFLLGASADSLTKTFSFSNQSVDISQFDFCVNSEDDVIYTDMQSEYSAIGYTDKNYYLVGATLNGTATNEIDLFLLQDDEAVEFFITLTQSLAPVADAYIHVAKYSVGEGIYKTVEIDITDTSGKIGAWLDLEKQYRFTVIKDDEILGIFERNSLCEAAPCEINLNLESDATDWMSIYTDTFAQNVLYNITFNPVTKIVDFSFVDTTGLATSFRMDIVKLDDYINGSEILNTQRVFTSSGSMTYNASLLDDGDYRVMTYIARSPDTFIEFIDFLINTFGTSFGMLGLIFSFLFILVVIFGMAVSPTLLILSIPFGMHMARLTGFFNLDVAVIVCFYVLGGLAIYAMNK